MVGCTDDCQCAGVYKKMLQSVHHQVEQIYHRSECRGNYTVTWTWNGCPAKSDLTVSINLKIRKLFDIQKIQRMGCFDSLRLFEAIHIPAKKFCWLPWKPYFVYHKTCRSNFKQCFLLFQDCCDIRTLNDVLHIEKINKKLAHKISKFLPVLSFSCSTLFITCSI